MKNEPTTNLALFSSRERLMAAKMLIASAEQGFPKTFENNNVRLMLDWQSKTVFFVNDDYQLCTMNGEKLEVWHFMAYNAHEGFADYIRKHIDQSWHYDDISYLLDFGVITEEEFVDWLEENEAKEADLPKRPEQKRKLQPSRGANTQKKSTRKSNKALTK
jgi:hypothetical protein